MCCGCQCCCSFCWYLCCLLHCGVSRAAAVAAVVTIVIATDRLLLFILIFSLLLVSLCSSDAAVLAVATFACCAATDTTAVAACFCPLHWHCHSWLLLLFYLAVVARRYCWLAPLTYEGEPFIYILSLIYMSSWQSLDPFRKVGSDNIYTSFYVPGLIPLFWNLWPGACLASLQVHCLSTYPLVPRKQLKLLLQLHLWQFTQDSTVQQ